MADAPATTKGPDEPKVIDPSTIPATEKELEIRARLAALKEELRILRTTPLDEGLVVTDETVIESLNRRKRVREENADKADGGDAKRQKTTLYAIMEHLRKHGWRLAFQTCVELKLTLESPEEVPIYRNIVVRLNASIQELHQMIQILFGWHVADEYAHEFEWEIDVDCKEDNKDKDVEMSDVKTKVEIKKEVKKENDEESEEDKSEEDEEEEEKSKDNSKIDVVLPKTATFARVGGPRKGTAVLNERIVKLCMLLHEKKCGQFLKYYYKVSDDLTWCIKFEAIRYETCKEVTKVFPRCIGGQGVGPTDVVTSVDDLKDVEGYFDPDIANIALHENNKTAVKTKGLSAKNWWDTI